MNRIDELIMDIMKKLTWLSDLTMHIEILEEEE
jgi:hypothetical protein